MRLTQLEAYISIDSESYQLQNVTSIEVTNPRENNIRSNPNLNTGGDGFIYSTGIGDQVSIVVNILEADLNFVSLLKDAYSKAKRVDFTGFDTGTGDSLKADASVLGVDPTVLNITENDEENHAQIILTLRCAPNNYDRIQRAV